MQTASLRHETDYRDSQWPAGLHRRSDLFHFRRMVDGRRVSRSLGTRNVNTAIKLAVELNTQIEDRGLPVDAAIARDRLAFKQLAEDYLSSRDLRPRSVKAYRSILCNFQRVAQAITGKPVLLLTDVTDPMVEKYSALRRTEPTARNGHPNTRKSLSGASSKTVAEERNLIASILRFAVDRKLLAVMPLSQTAKGQRKERDRDVARPLLDDEVPRLLAAARGYDAERAGDLPYATFFHSLLTAFLYTGLRHQEMRFLEWTDVNFASGLVRVRRKLVACKRLLRLSPAAQATLAPLLDGKRADQPALRPEDLDRAAFALCFRQMEVLRTLKPSNFDLAAGTLRVEEQFEWEPKGMDGDVPMYPSLAAMLRDLHGRRTSNFVFPDRDGGYWRLRFERHLQAIALLAEITDFTRVHDLRHTLGATLRRQGVALETIQEILRHQCVEDTLRYARYEVAEGRDAIARLPRW